MGYCPDEEPCKHGVPQKGAGELPLFGLGERLLKETLLQSSSAQNGVSRAGIPSPVHPWKYSKLGSMRP